MIEETVLGLERTVTFKAIIYAGNFLRKIGLDPFQLNADRIILKAKKKAHFSGAISSKTENGLRKLIHSINREAQPNPFGAMAAKSLFERTLYGRLKVEQVLAENPTIEESEIKEPVFIIGMPRTGTTILHALLHEDEQHRSPLAWECILPYPVPQPDTFYDNPQLATVAKEFRQLFKLVPDFQKKHYMTATSPQECLGINALDFNSFQTCAQFYIPSYMHWFFNEADKLSTMRFHKRFLQYLQSGGVKAKRWLLKSPVHLIRLKEIFTVYPDARIIMTHRHPSKVVASATSLISSVRSLYSDQENPHRSGKEQAKVWSDCFNRFLESRRSLDKEDQIIDLKFEDFVADQMGTVQKIYQRFGWTLEENNIEKMKHFLDQNPKDKHGIHHYTLEQFGLTEAGINKQFKPYIEFLATL